MKHSVEAKCAVGPSVLPKYAIPEEKPSFMTACAVNLSTAPGPSTQSVIIQLLYPDFLDPPQKLLKSCHNNSRGEAEYV